MDRNEELALNWQSTMQSIQDACVSANRDFSEVTVVAVTKTWPASDIDMLASLGVTNIGENRDQEARDKHQQVTAHGLTWHAIGQIQTNKVKSIINWADVVHSLDRPELIDAFVKHLTPLDKQLDVFVQVNLDENISEHRGGVARDRSLQLAELVGQHECFRLLGVMGVAPLNGDTERAFATLQSISQSVQEVQPEARFISAGMSDDYKIALKYGATHLRLGSLILGHRTYNG